MRYIAFVTCVVALLVSQAGNARGQGPDPKFEAKIAQPAYTSRHPVVLCDGAHFNFHTIGGTYKRYKPFADLLVADGYRVTPNRQKFTKAVLGPYQVLVISRAMGGPHRVEAESAQPAFEPAECDAVRDWVRAGGALLLITDIHPFGAAARDLAQRFGVEMSNGATIDPVNSDGDNRSILLFTQENRLLGDHPIMQGRDESERINRVVSYSGQSLKGPADSVALLKLGDTAVDQSIDGVKAKTAPAKGRSQGLALTFGKGRVVVLGEAAMLTAQLNNDGKPFGMNAPGQDDQQFTLNVMHWLSGLSAEGASLASTSPSTPAPTPAPAPAKPSAKPVATAPATAPRGTLSAADIAQQSEASIALVKGKGSSGTGFLVGPGVLLTNAHVINDEFASDIEVVFPSADEAKKGPFPAELIYEDAKRDLAILAVKTDLPPLRIASSYTFRKGEDVTVIGNPGVGGDVVLENAISRGVMSTKVVLNGLNFYQMGIAVNPGNSGGPVFDSTGQVIGVVTLKTSKQEALAFSIPVEDVRAALDAQAAQTPAETNKTRSTHRASVAVQDIGSVGALYCLGIDLRRALASPAGKSIPNLQATTQKIDGILGTLAKDVLPGLATQTTAARKDTLVPPSVREKIGKLGDNLGRLQAAYANPAGLSPNALMQLKTTHRDLMTDLFGRYNLALPENLMPLFENHPVPQSGVVANLAPPAPRTSLHDRIQERKAASRGSSNSLRDRAKSKMKSLRDR